MPKILGQTPHWIVVSKPPGMPTLPDRSGSLTLLDWAKTHYGAIWIVHRIDRETSGLVLLARTQEDHRRASLWFQNREVKKTYFALAVGNPSSPIVKFSALIEGKPSITQMEVVEKYTEGFLARLTPRTGRRHQIRIHLSQKGYPLWGDVRYGGPSEVSFKDGLLKIPRTALHASKLELPSGEKFEAPFEEDFSGWVSELRNRGQHV